MINESSYAAVDPMALILSGRAYLAWTELHHPHVPKIGEIQEALQSMTPEEQKATLSRAKTLVAFGKAVEEAHAAFKK